MVKIMQPAEAIALIKSGSSIMVGGFGNIGNPKKLIDMIAESDITSLTVIANDLGTPNVGLGRLVTNQKVKKAIGSYFTYNTEAGKLYFEGKLNLEMKPQGTFAECIRAGGCGIGGFYTRVGVCTVLADNKEEKSINGKRYILEMPLRANVAILRASKADTVGNLVFEKTARNFNPIMAMAADLTIVEVDEIVAAGTISPEEVIVPGVYTDVLVKVEAGE